MINYTHTHTHNYLYKKERYENTDMLKPITQILDWTETHTDTYTANNDQIDMISG